MTLAISPALERPVFTMLPLLTTHEHQSAATSMREAITIEYIVLLMTDSHLASLKVLHRSLGRKELSCKLRFSVETPRPMCTKGGLGFGLVKN